MKLSGIIALGLLVCVCSVFAQPKTEIQFVDNCFNVDGGVLFCLEVGIQSCDSEWYYQILTPPNDAGVSYVLDNQIVQSGESSSQCYQVDGHEDLCQYCVGFLDSNVADNGVRVALHVDLTCGETTISYPHNVMRVQGQPCGEEGYHYLPCESRLGLPDVGEPQGTTVFQLRGDCLYIGRETPELYCPTLLMDTCSQTGRVETLEGFKAQIFTGYTDPVCTEISTGTVCETAEIVDYQEIDSYVSVSANVHIEYECDSDQPCHYLTTMNLVRHYPLCGGALEEICMDEWPAITHSTNGGQDNHHDDPDPVVDEMPVGDDDSAASGLYVALVIGGIAGVVGLCLLLTVIGVFVVLRKKPANDYKPVAFY